MALSIPPRVLARMRVTLASFEGVEGCWPWPKSIFKATGYGQVAWRGDDGITGTTAHRVAWTATHGAIPDEMTVDHRCRRRECIRPSHLRLLSNLDNAKDNGQGRKTECPRGHAYDETNTYRDPKGHRRCRRCAADKNRSRKR